MGPFRSRLVGVPPSMFPLLTGMFPICIGTATASCAIVAIVNRAVSAVAIREELMDIVRTFLNWKRQIRLNIAKAVLEIVVTFLRSILCIWNLRTHVALQPASYARGLRRFSSPHP